MQNKNSILAIILVALTFSCTEGVKSNSSEVLEETEQIEQHKDTETTVVDEKQKNDSINTEDIWNNRLSKMTDKNEAKKIDLFHFPLEGDYGYSMELKGDVDQWTKSGFYSNYDKFFTPEVMSKLDQSTYFDLDILDEENKETEIQLTLDFIYVIEDFQAESSIMFYAKAYDGVWKVYKILMAG